MTERRLSYDSDSDELVGGAGPFCGLDDPPKGRRRGTVQECLDRNQVKYYGLESAGVKEALKKKGQKKHAGKAGREKLIREMTKHKFNVKRMLDEFNKAKKDNKHTKKQADDIRAENAKYQQAVKQLQELQEEEPESEAESEPESDEPEESTFKATQAAAKAEYEFMAELKRKEHEALIKRLPKRTVKKLHKEGLSASEQKTLIKKVKDEQRKMSKKEFKGLKLSIDPKEFAKGKYKQYDIDPEDELWEARKAHKQLLKIQKAKPKAKPKAKATVSNQMTYDQLVNLAKKVYYDEHMDLLAIITPPEMGVVPPEIASGLRGMLGPYEEALDFFEEKLMKIIKGKMKVPADQLKKYILDVATVNEELLHDWIIADDLVESSELPSIAMSEQVVDTFKKGKSKADTDISKFDIRPEKFAKGKYKEYQRGDRLSDIQKEHDFIMQSLPKRTIKKLHDEGLSPAQQKTVVKKVKALQNKLKKHGYKFPSIDPSEFAKGAYREYAMESLPAMPKDDCLEECIKKCRAAKKTSTAELKRLLSKYDKDVEKLGEDLAGRKLAEQLRKEQMEEIFSEHQALLKKPKGKAKAVDDDEEYFKNVLSDLYKYDADPSAAIKSVQASVLKKAKPKAKPKAEPKKSIAYAERQEWFNWLPEPSNVAAPLGSAGFSYDLYYDPIGTFEQLKQIIDKYNPDIEWVKIDGLEVYPGENLQNKYRAIIGRMQPRIGQVIPVIVRVSLEPKAKPKAKPKPKAKKAKKAKKPKAKAVEEPEAEQEYVAPPKAARPFTFKGTPETNISDALESAWASMYGQKKNC